MVVCENGHLFTDQASPEAGDPDRHCEQCGARMLLRCPSCRTPIPGRAETVSGLSDAQPIPEYCFKCGEPLPWTQRRAEEKPRVIFDPLDRIDTIVTRFPAIVRQLRDRREGRPTLELEDEYDAQGLLHALLTIDFDDIRPEEWTPSYAGRASRMDFVLKKHEIVVEAKKTRRGLGPKEVGEQLIIDVTKYKTHPDCKTLVCFVYDPEHRIGNPHGLKTDLQNLSTDDMKIVVHISPM